MNIIKIKIKEIAEKAGVSISTVSKVIHHYSGVSQDTRQKVNTIMAELGYKVHYRNQNNSSTKCIGIILGKDIPFNHPYFSKVIDVFKDVIYKEGFDFVFFSNQLQSNEKTKNYLLSCREYQVDGCLILAEKGMGNSIIDLDTSDVPCVGIDVELSGDKSSYIMTDNDQIAKKAVEHFYLHGYKDIGYIGINKKWQVAKLREEGFKKALSNYGLKIHKQWFVHGENFESESGYEVMKQMLQSNQLPRAIFAWHDIFAIGAMNALKEQHVNIPEDIAIIGCDDIDAGKYLSPPLTTVLQDHEKIGKLAAQMLMDIMNNKKLSPIQIEPGLVVRGTA
ncbi:LacI family DNA-binding transcriptional regulator [Chengkuizengella axinellae]|uniref:LacI family DNA-binding transcriptional regulator n=1 Tax=Chengkuizengella axinellae TaxID=3064388 RepID=A0ABT9IUE7_9BACL|nr:LacI family DNA-binding transcriptional regulator [Chengkuizengella sp. 2205SS18-9]MDP5272908.1 LacI family DNA-binding transcriptional regulator [Chengkuizengella sp. 2205SS18-9]